MQYTIIFTDEAMGDNDYVYVETGKDVEEITLGDIAEQRPELELDDEDLSELLVNNSAGITCICWVPGHVAVNFP